MASIKRATSEPVEFLGVGGDWMRSEGLDTLFPLSELSVMGVAEILPHLARLRGRISETIEAAKNAQPDLIITIDAPAFCFRVLKRLKGLSTKKIHYVAPTVWAWRPGRARKIAPLVDHLMVLLPFEPPYFRVVGLPTTFVGHPVLENNIGKAEDENFRHGREIEADVPLLCLLPGSRRGELKYLLPPFKEAVNLLKSRIPTLQIVVPTVKNLSDILREELQDWEIPFSIVEGQQEKFGAMAAANAALAASGTVALELAVLGVPNVIAYRVHPVTAAIVRRLVRVKYANLVNLLIDREAVPEFIQQECRGDLLCDAIENLLENSVVADTQKLAMAEAIALLSPGEAVPSDVAADTVLRLAAE